MVNQIRVTPLVSSLYPPSVSSGLLKFSYALLPIAFSCRV
jgi:hypothetical protein